MGREKANPRLRVAACVSKTISGTRIKEFVRLSSAQRSNTQKKTVCLARMDANACLDTSGTVNCSIVSSSCVICRRT